MDATDFIPLPSRAALLPFQVMTKPAGCRCNLDCSYCFYLEKESLYPGARTMRMPAEILENYVRDYIEAQPGNVVNFAWQGGEPTLMGVGFFREALALQKKYAKGKTIENALQTNGTLLDDEWGEFLAAEKFLVGISIDGPRGLHDAHRTDKGGRPTFDRVMSGIETLKKHRVEFNTLTTVNNKNVRQPEDVYRFLKKNGSGFMQFIPIVERLPDSTDSGLALAPPPDGNLSDDAEEQVTDWSVRGGEYGEFLRRIFDEWVRQDVGRVFVQQFDAALANWAGAPAGICVFSEKCGRALAVEHNGDVYACDHYVYPEYKLGNLSRTPLARMVDSERQLQFGSDKSAALPKYCLECPVLFACRGECPKHRFLKTPDGEPGLNYLCEGYRKFFTHIGPAMRTMAALYQAGRAPAEIMSIPKHRWLAAEK